MAASRTQEVLPEIRDETHGSQDPITPVNASTSSMVFQQLIWQQGQSSSSVCAHTQSCCQKHRLNGHICPLHLSVPRHLSCCLGSTESKMPLLHVRSRELPWNTNIPHLT